MPVSIIARINVNMDDHDAYVDIDVVVAVAVIAATAATGGMSNNNCYVLWWQQ